MIGCFSLFASKITDYLSFDRLPFAFDISLMAFFWIIIGYLSGDFIGFIKTKAFLSWCFVIVGICGVAFSVQYNIVPVLMYKNQYGIYPLMVLGAFSGILLFLSLFSIFSSIFARLNVVKQFVKWLGINSLSIFPVHLILVWFFYRLLNNFLGIQNWMLEFCLVILVLIPIVNILTTNCRLLNGGNYFKNGVRRKKFEQKG